MIVAACSGLERLDKHEQVVWCQKKEGRQVDFFFLGHKSEIAMVTPRCFCFLTIHVPAVACHVNSHAIVCTNSHIIVYTNIL
jgi:hypothetical protein